MNNKNILIYGVPGVGKTYLSEKYRKEFQYPKLELDTLRDIAKQNTNIENNPFYFYGTTEAYKYFGEPIQENITKGLKEVRKAMLPFIKEKLSSLNTPRIIEGAFLDPKYAKSFGEVILLVQENKEIHKKQFFKHREENTEMLESFRIARILQDFLIKEAKDLQVRLNHIP